MPYSITLSEHERELLLDLLAHAERELPVQIHHASKREARELLSARLHAVRELVPRLESQGSAVPQGAGAGA